MRYGSPGGYVGGMVDGSSWKKPRSADAAMAELAVGSGWYRSRRNVKHRREAPIEYEALFQARPASGRDVVVTGLLLRRTDGGSIRVRDVSRLQLGDLFRSAQMLWHWVAPLAGPTAPQVRPSRPGRRGHDDEHYARIYELWQRAQTVAPRRPIAWMREQFPDNSENPRPNLATMHRWRDRAVELHAAAEAASGQLTDEQGRAYDSVTGVWRYPEPLAPTPLDHPATNDAKEQDR